MTKIHTFGDSILDCARYNQYDVAPGALLARNDDQLFPEFAGRDLTMLLGRRPGLAHHAVDGATSRDLLSQMRGIHVAEADIVLLTIGGNDLLQGLLVGNDSMLRGFEHAVSSALSHLRHTQLFVGNVYDPSFGDDRQNFLGVDPAPARRRHLRVNSILAELTMRSGGRLVDLHAHFLTGAPDWFSTVIEPSLSGASEVRRAFLASWESRPGSQHQ